MRDVYLTTGVRTAIGKLGGAFKEIEADFLAAKVLRELVDRTGIPDNALDEVILGQTKQSTDTPNIARLALLRAGLPIELAGYTVHRQCGSGLQAINNAAQMIMCGLADVIAAGGTESMSTAPYYMRNARYGLGAGNGMLLDPNTESQPRSQPIETYGSLTMGLTAEYLADDYRISREDQDAFAYASQQKALQAIREGRLKDQIVPYEVKSRKFSAMIDTDEHPRDTSLEELARLKPVFRDGGSVTAGNTSGRNDGAAAVMVLSEEAAKRYGINPEFRMVTQATVGVAPDRMGIGPAPAVRKALQQAGLKLADIDLIELNEAFAAQALACIRELDMNMDKVNVNGGAIAFGHPLGATGAILMVKLMAEMRRQSARYGLVTLCIGGGQGIATIVERI